MPSIKTKEEFTNFSTEFQGKHTMPYAYAMGTGFFASDDSLNAVRYNVINIDQHKGTLSVLMDHFGIEVIEKPTLITLTESDSRNILKKYFLPFRGERDHKNRNAIQNNPAPCCMIYPDEKSLRQEPPTSAPDVLCRLAMLSNLAFKPNELNLDGMFGLLKNLLYSANFAMTIEDWNRKFFWTELPVVPAVIDKIPPFWWGAPIPPGVRIADLSRIRLGAYLSPGTTVMHEGFVNFNAGTLGKSMVEGRISAGVTVDDGSDIGGGASIMGTLSGGGKEKITIGKNCLIGANAGTGISLGDDCTIEAGLYITAGTKVTMVGWGSGNIAKASELSGKNRLLFRRNSETGRVECLPNGKGAELNSFLH